MDHAYTGTTLDESDYVVFTSHGGTEVGSTTSYYLTPTAGGLHVLDSSGVVCEPFTGLPAPLPDISALELLEQPVSTDPSTVHRSLLVGFKGYYADGTDPSLYRCALPQSGPSATSGYSCSAEIACVAIPDSEGLDVRDIQVDVDMDFQTAWVADAGRVPDSSGSCASAGASRVYEWEIDILTPSSDVLVDVTDNLTAPDDGAHHFLASELVGLAMAPDSDYLFAFFPEGQDAAYDDTEVKLWRNEVHHASWADPWVPMSDVDDASREPLVQGGYPSVNDQWMDDLVARASWAPAYAVDGAFIESASCISPTCMLVADGFGVWRVDGWDTSAPNVDTDLLWNLQLGDYPDEFQTTVVTDIAVSKKASPPFAFAAVADLGGMWLDVPASSELGLADFEAYGRSELECNWDAWNTASGRVEIFEDTVWYASAHQSSGNDYQGFSRWDGASWCYEGTDSVLNPGRGASLSCRDASSAWTDCGSDGGDGWVDAVTLTRLSNPSDIEVFDDEVAFAAVVGTGTAAEVGLYVTFDGGATWEEVTFTPTLDGANGGPTPPYSIPGTCRAERFFANNVRIALRPNDPADATAYNAYDSSTGTYSFDLVAGSRNPDTATHCGLMRVTFDDTTGPGGATWAPIPLGEEEEPWPSTIDYYGSYGRPCESGEVTFSEVAWITVSGSTGVPEQRLLVLNTLTNESPDFDGGLCLIDPEDYTDTQYIVDATDLPVSFRTVVEDPTSADVFYLGANVDESTRGVCRIVASRGTWWQMPDGNYADGPEDCDTWQVPGPYQLEYDVASDSWSIALMSTTGLDNPNILAMDWGGDADYYAVLYAGTNGSGVYHHRNPLCLDIAPYSCD